MNAPTQRAQTPLSFATHTKIHAAPCTLRTALTCRTNAPEPRHKHHFHSLRTPKFTPHHAHRGQRSHPRKRTTARADSTQPHERITAPRTNDAHTCHTKDTHACCTSDTHACCTSDIHACRTSSSPHTLPRATLQPAPQRFRA